MSTKVVAPPKLPENVKEQFTDTRFGRMRSRVLGERSADVPPVVIVMGMAVATYLMPAQAELASWTEAHLVELPGLGGSGDASHKLDVTEYAEAVNEWLVAAKFPPVILVGHSSGTQVIAAAAAARPDLVMCLVLASPTIDPKARNLLKLVYYWQADGYRYKMPGLAENHKPEWKRAGIKQIINLLRVHKRHRLETEMMKLHMPVLIMMGDEDKLTSEEWCRRLEALAPCARLLVVKGPHTFVWSNPGVWSKPIRQLAEDSQRRAEETVYHK